MPIDTTPGGASANSYASVAEYKTYWQSRYWNTNALAASVTDPVIEQLLEWSALLLDAAFRWTGGAVDGVQNLNWPRTGMLSPNGFPIPTSGVDSIPERLKQAQCEFAGNLVLADRTLDNASTKVIGTETAIKSVKAGSVEVTFGSNTFSTFESFDAYVRSLSSDFAYLSKAIPDSVRLLIPPSWYRQSSLRRPFILEALG